MLHRSESNAEKKVIAASLVSKAPLRELGYTLAALINIPATWRRGTITGFCDGEHHSKEPFSLHHSFEVEVMFEDASVKSYANRSLLRSPEEAIIAPSGPPQWKNSEARLALGADIVVFEVDPECAALALARYLGVESFAVQCFKHWATLVQDLIDSTGTNGVNVSNALYLGGLHLNRRVSLTEFMRIVFDMSHLLQRGTESRTKFCDKLLFGGHSAAIVSAVFSDIAKVIVSVDQNGWCCLWDTNNPRVSLSLISPFSSPALVGHHPFSLVARMQIAECKLPHIAGMNVSVSSMCRFSCPSDTTPPFPLTAESLNAAYKVDCKFPTDEVKVRGLIYVMVDMTRICLETTAFLPSLVSMDCANAFMCSPTLLSNIVTHQGKSSLQRLYESRDRIHRIVYAVSCAHSSLERLADDLSAYGVLQRGYTKTPSERIDVVCFENSSSRAYSVKSTTADAIRPANCRCGIIVGHLKDDKLIVALDNSNDIIHVNMSDILVAFDRPSALKNENEDRFMLGCKVKFKYSSVTTDRVGYKDNANTAEMFVVQLNLSTEKEQMGTCAVTMFVGRNSCVMAAADCCKTSVSEATSKQLRISYMKYLERLFGSYSAFLFRRSSLLRGWRSCFSYNACRVLQSGVFVDKERLILRGELTGASALPAVGSLSPIHDCVYYSVLGLVLTGFLESCDDSHPLALYIWTVLGRDLSELLRSNKHLVEEDVARENTKRTQEKYRGKSWYVDDLFKPFLGRRGIRTEELFAHSYFMALGAKGNTMQIEILSDKLYNNLRRSGTSLSDSIGPLMREDITFSCITTEKMIAVAAEGSSGADNDGLLSSSFRVNMKNLKKSKGAMQFLLREEYFLFLNVLLHRKLDLRRKETRNSFQASLATIMEASFYILKDVLRSPRNCTANGKVNSFNPVLNHIPDPGSYTILSRRRYDSMYLPVDIITARASTMSSDVNCDTQFLVWCGLPFALNTCEELEGSFFKQWSVRVKRLQEASLSTAHVIHCLNNVDFGPEYLKCNTVIMEWDDSLVSLRTFCANAGERGLISNNRFLLFQQIASGLIDALNSIHDSGFVLRSLSPSTIFLGGDSKSDNVTIRILPMPTLLEMGEKSSPVVDAALLSICNSWMQNDLGVRTSEVNWNDSDGLSTPSCDFFALGICLFKMAFGIGPRSSLFELSGEADIAACLLADLVGCDVEKNDSTSLTDSTEDLLMGKLVGSPHTLLFLAIEKTMDISTKNLKYFWEEFYDQAINGDDISTGGLLVDSVAVSVWEKWMLKVSCKLRVGGSYGMVKLGEKVTSCSFMMTAGESIDRIRALMKDTFDLRMTAQEVDLFVRSLFRASMRGSVPPAAKPVHEQSIEALRHFESLFEIIVAYGVMQEILFAISQCLRQGSLQSSDSKSFLSSLKMLPLFDPIDVKDRSVVSTCTHSLLSGYRCTPPEFVRKFLFTPLIACINEVVSELGTVTAGDASRSIHVDEAQSKLEHSLVHNHLETLSKIMCCIEELLLVRCANLLKTHTQIKYEKLPCLCASGVDVKWIIEESNWDILEEIVESELLFAIAMFSLRFLSTDISRTSNLDSSKPLELHDDAADINFGTMSMGFRLLLRVSKFLDNVSVCLNSMCRQVYTAMKKNSNFSSTVEGVNASFESMINERYLVEKYFFTVMSVITMLCSGEEVCAPQWGRRHRLLPEAYAGIFENIETGMKAAALVALQHWSVQLTQLFEPLLLTLVAEDGKGNSAKLQCSADCIYFAEKHVEALAMKILPLRCRNNTATYWQMSVTRGSPFYTAYIRISRGLAEYYHPNGKKSVKQQLHFVSTVLSLLPSIDSDQGVLGEDNDFDTVQSSEVSLFPDPAVWQRVQAMVDARVVVHIQNFLDASTTQTCAYALKLCYRSLMYCARLAPSTITEEPFASLAEQLTAHPWVHGIVEVLRDKRTRLSSEVFMLATKCLYAMTTNNLWMRYWPLCDVLPFLVSSKKMMLGQPNVEIQKRLVNKILGAISVKNSSYVSAAVSIRILSANTLPNVVVDGNMIIPMTAKGLLAEANDLAFGSTLNEQLKFCDSLESWVQRVFDTQLSCGTGCDEGECWDTSGALVCKITSWIPAMSMPVEIEYKDSDRKHRANQSGEIIIRQVQVIEKILLHLLSSKHPQAFDIAVQVLWSKSNISQMLDDVSEFEMEHDADGGLVAVLKHLETANSAAENFLSVRVQLSIVHVLVGIIEVSSGNDLTLFCRLGIADCCLRFISHCMKLMRVVVRRTALHGEFKRLHNSLIRTIRSVWEALVSCGSGDVQDVMCASGITKTLIKDWLPDVCNLGIQNASKSKDISVFIVRFEAICMLRQVLVYKDKAEKLMFDLSRHVVAESVVVKESSKLRSISTKKGAGLLRVSAGHVLALLAEWNVEDIESSMTEYSVPRILMTTTIKFGSMHPFSLELWQRWGTNAFHAVEEDDAIADDENDDIPEVPHTSKITSRTTVATELNADANQLSFAVEAMGSLILAIKNKFDEHTGGSPLLSKDSAIALLMDLCLKGSTLAKCIAVLDRTINMGMDFPAFLSVYSACVGLKAPPFYPSTDSNNGSMWVPTSRGIWDKLDRLTVKTLDAICKSSSLGQQYDEPNEDCDLIRWVSLEQLPGILRKLAKNKHSPAGVVPSPKTVEEAISVLHVFLPGAGSGQFSLQEVGVLYRYHQNLSADHCSGTTTPGSVFDATRNYVAEEGEKIGSGDENVPLQGHQEIERSNSTRSFRYRDRISSDREEERARSPHPAMSNPIVDHARKRKRRPANAGYLPTVSNLRQRDPVTRAEVAKEFSRLDVTGEGKLTFLSIKSALEIFGEGGSHDIDDAFIRLWIRNNDAGNKGWVDIDDFCRIFAVAKKLDDRGHGIFAQSNAGNQRGGKNLERIKSAFIKYDADGDGFISESDLRSAFSRMGKSVSTREIIDWVQLRDSSGNGAVSFEDFVTYFGQ
eukprot:CAMPEP_0185044780 /NCGR_PEP_ID=MMETSP1103-20130426/43620_1 /TAXON_ID=36769 /ORGANISM="Paraphysomonas bandaiensis, Strain Caron Lab Isolate" /LENGTH=2943 /DNA_ID=CAMNT_0027585053 /DNA_START=1363 /DNA_END=10194 /DNA_ORIENTATION=-